MFISGISIQKIANHFNVSRAKITSILKNLGYTSDFRKRLPEQEIINYYFSDDKITITSVAMKYNISNAIIRKIFAKHNISVKPFHLKRKINLDSEYIKDKYLKNNLSCKEIASILNVSTTTIIKNLKESGVQLKNESEASRKYYMDSNFFENIDCEKKAYWLGFMFADGYVASNLKDFGITLSVKDSSHVQKFINDIKYTGNVKIYNQISSYANSDIAKCVPRNEKVCADLISHGCIPRKTHFTERPTGVPDYLIKHFIRGVVDGDGGIYLYEKSMSVEIVGDYDLLLWIKESSPVELSNLQKHKSIYRLRTYTESAFEFASWLYDDATVYLDRKYERFIKQKEKIS